MLSYNPKTLLSTSANPAQGGGDAYASNGVLTPHYITALAPTMAKYNQNAAAFSNLNAADRLAGFFLDVYTGSHIKYELPHVVSRVQDPITKLTLAGYTTHAKAVGENILAALGTYRSTSSGENKTIFTNESFLACGHYNRTANTAVFNAAFSHFSAKHEVRTVGFYNQITDFWQGSSKHVWWRAEKHFQIQAATLGVYSSEAVEENFNKHYEFSVDRQSRASTWKINIGPRPTTPIPGIPITPPLDREYNYEINVHDAFNLRSSEVKLKAANTLLLEARETYLRSAQIYLEAAGVLKLTGARVEIGSSSILQLTGSQIFLNTGVVPLISPPVPDAPELELNPNPIPPTLPEYPRTALNPNRPGAVTLVGNQTMQSLPL